MAKSNRKTNGPSRGAGRRMRTQQIIFYILAALVIASFLLSLVSTY
ncbi:MAG: hypothetical protein ACRDHY_09625 [Anaerolineales bacterium]